MPEESFPYLLVTLRVPWHLLRQDLLPTDRLPVRHCVTPDRDRRHPVQVHLFANHIRGWESGGVARTTRPTDDKDSVDPPVSLLEWSLSHRGTTIRPL